jgi:hypothetical protein
MSLESYCKKILNEANKDTKKSVVSSFPWTKNPESYSDVNKVKYDDLNDEQKEFVDNVPIGGVGHEDYYFEEVPYEDEMSDMPEIFHVELTEKENERIIIKRDGTDYPKKAIVVVKNERWKSDVSE